MLTIEYTWDQYPSYIAKITRDHIDIQSPDNPNQVLYDRFHILCRRKQDELRYGLTPFELVITSTSNAYFQGRHSLTLQEAREFVKHMMDFVDAKVVCAWLGADATSFWKFFAIESERRE